MKTINNHFETNSLAMSFKEGNFIKLYAHDFESSFDEDYGRLEGRTEMEDARSS